MTASTFYFENWRLALDAVDYLAQDHAVSPFQHFWSLGVQVSILYPLADINHFRVFNSPENLENTGT